MKINRYDPTFFGTVVKHDKGKYVDFADYNDAVIMKSKAEAILLAEKKYSSDLTKETERWFKKSLKWMDKYYYTLWGFLVSLTTNIILTFKYVL